ncbi:MAG: ABC transporter ATP-binding protein [Gemmatimonadales bacterium]
MTQPGERPPPAVEFVRVSKHYGSAAAVDQISLDIQPGEFFSLLGPSGCGKTTTLRLLAGFETPDAGSGDIRINGRRVNDERPYQRGVGMVFQSYALFPHLSVEKNVAFGLEQRRVPRAEIPDRVRRALELVRLDPGQFARRSPAQLSGGQRQRVALARALVLEPRILLLDEPLGALDLKLRKEMQLELKGLNRALGITFVYVTHDQEEALTMSDRIAVMDGGRIAQLGSPADVYENPRTAFVASFIGESNFFAGRSESLGGRRWRIAGPHGVFEVIAEPDVRVEPGVEVGIAVRPEWMDVFPLDDVPPGENRVPGTVQEIIYLGETLHVIVALDAGGLAKVALRNEGQLIKPIPWTRGARAAVAWLPEDCQVLEPAG